MAKTTKTTKKTEKAAAVESAVDMSKVSEIAKSLREFRFGAAGSKAKNTSLPKMMRKTRAQLLTAERAAKTLAISEKKA
jgi:ribosomal protein L29